MVKGCVGSGGGAAAATDAPARHTRLKAKLTRSADMGGSLSGDTSRLYSHGLLGADPLDLRQWVTFLRCCVLPIAQLGILQRVVQVRLRCRAQARAVRLKAKKHRREHRVGNAEVAEQPVTAAAVLLAAARPNLIDSCDVRPQLGRLRHTPISGAYVHRALIAQRLKARVHFRGDRAGPGRSQAIAGGAAACRLGGIFTDRERIPDFDAVVDEQRNAPRRRLRRDLRLIIALIERNDLFGESERGLAQEYPGP